MDLMRKGWKRIFFVVQIPPPLLVDIFILLLFYLTVPSIPKASQIWLVKAWVPAERVLPVASCFPI